MGQPVNAVPDVGDAVRPTVLRHGAKTEVTVRLQAGGR
jgi:hypothetical protein